MIFLGSNAGHGITYVLNMRQSVGRGLDSEGTKESLSPLTDKIYFYEMVFTPKSEI